MQRILIKIGLFFSMSWAIGLQGLTIPQNAQILGTAGSGLAANIDPNLNPAMIVSTHSFLQFSLNNWLGDIKGSHTVFHWGREFPKQVSIQSWSAKELELWDDKPADEPLGSFGVHLVSAAFSISHHFDTPYRFGMRLQTNYSHLFSETISGITLDAGLVAPISSSINLGAVVRNLGYENTNGLRAELPLELGLGSDIKIPIIKTSILVDLIYLSRQRNEIKIGAVTHWKWLNFRAGSSIGEKRKANALGISFNYRSWQIHYGIYFHENPVLGIPQFMDIRRYL